LKIARFTIHLSAAAECSIPTQARQMMKVLEPLNVHPLVTVTAQPTVTKRNYRMTDEI